MPLIRKPASAASASAASLTSPAAASQGLTTQALAQRLLSADEETRWTAARAASGLREHFAQLTDALTREASPRVREALFSSLSAASTPQAVESILPFIRSDDAQLRTGALDALRVMAPVVESYLPALLSDRDADVRVLACELVRDVPADRASTLLATLLDRELSANVCAAAVEVLAETGDAQALPALQACAARFRSNAFLEFSIRVTISRIHAQTVATPVGSPSLARPID